MPTLRDSVMKVVREGMSDDLRFTFSGESERFAAPQTFITMLSSLPGIQENERKLVNYFEQRFNLSIYDVGEALVRRAFDVGVDSAVGSLFEFIEQDYSPFIQVVLLRGVSVPGKFQLSDDIFIAGPDEVPSKALKLFLKERIGVVPTVDYRSPTLLVDHVPPVQTPDSVLYRLIKARPKFFDMEDPAAMIFDVDDIGVLRKVSELLVLLSPSIVINRRSYSELQEDAFLYGVGSRAWEGKYQNDGAGRVRDVTLAELEEFKRTLTTYFALSKAQRENLDVPVHRLNEAVRHDNLVDQAIDLGVAMESLLLAGLGDKSQLSLTFRLRGAWLLGRDAAERKAIYLLLKDIYNCRSSAAHAGKISQKAKETAKAEATLKEGLPLCARAIKEVIFRADELTPAYWDELLLGGIQ